MSERCPATNQAGEQCRRTLGEGEVVCRYHGGATRAARAKAAERRAEANARRVLEALEFVEPCDDPIAALYDIAGQTMALVNALRSVVVRLEEVSYSGGVGAGQEQIRGELQAYLAALGRAESVNARIVSLDLEARRVRVSEHQADVMSAALLAVLAALGLDLATQERGRELLSVELMERAR